MAQHKWHKEIKHWADGGEVEILYTEGAGSKSDWMIVDSHVDWDFKNCEFRIKPQPKEPQYLYAFLLEVGTEEGQIVFGLDDSHIDGFSYIGKIKLETDDDRRPN